jgi:hypothetical protein
VNLSSIRLRMRITHLAFAKIWELMSFVRGLSALFNIINGSLSK